jgi:tetratricopeptide (TPR) repeat protein
MRDLAAKLEREGAAAVVAEDVPEDERDAMTSLNASLAASYEVVAKHSPDAMRLFGALSLFPAGLLGAVLDEITGLVWRPALRLLRRYGLVEKGHVGHAVVLPPLRSYGASHLADAERRRLVARAQGVYAEAAQAVLAHAGKGRDAVAEAVVRGEEANMLAMVRAEGEPARDADGRTAHGRLVVAVGRLLASVLDRPGDAEAVLRVGEARARATGDPRSRAEILKVMGDAAVLRGAHSAGLDRYQQALALCEEHGDVATEAETAAAIGNLIASTGDVSAARAWLRRAWTRHRDSGAPVEVGRMLGLAAIVAAQADPRWALRIGRAACRLARNAQDAFAEQLCWASEAGYWFAAARVACAVLASETALGLSPSVTPRRPHVEALELQRGVLAEAGNRPGSLACLRGILETCRELKDVHMPPHEARWAEVQEEAQRDEELAELLALIEKAPEAVRKAAVAHELSRMSEEDKREFEELKPATMEEIDRWLKDGTIPE